MTSVLLQISCWIQRWKNFENRQTFGKVMNGKYRWSFLTHITVKSQHTSVLVVPARRLLIQWFPFVRAFLTNLNNISLDLVTSVVLRFTPRQRHRVFIDVLDKRRASLTWSVCHAQQPSSVKTEPVLLARQQPSRPRTRPRRQPPNTNTKTITVSYHWDHTVLPATRQRWLSCLYPSRSWYSI